MSSSFTALVIGAAWLAAGCGGLSARDEPSPRPGAGAASGRAGTGGDSGGGGSGANAATGGAGAASVDVYGNCPAGIDYFISIGGDLPPNRLSAACPEHARVASVPFYDDLHGLDPSGDQRAAFIACDGGERLEVWRMPPNPAELSTAGLYTLTGALSYSTCGTSRYVVDTGSCGPLGSMTLSESADSPAVLEGSYTMTLFDAGGKQYAVSGDYRACSYLPRDP